jgi:hypothetical protein
MKSLCQPSTAKDSLTFTKPLPHGRRLFTKRKKQNGPSQGPQLSLASYETVHGCHSEYRRPTLLLFGLDNHCIRLLTKPSKTRSCITILLTVVLCACRMRFRSLEEECTSINWKCSSSELYGPKRMYLRRREGPRKFDQMVTILTCKREVPSLNLFRDSWNILIGDFLGHSSRILERYYKRSQERYRSQPSNLFFSLIQLFDTIVSFTESVG